MCPIYPLILDQSAARGFSDSVTDKGDTRSIDQRSLPSMNKRYWRALSPAMFSMVKAPNLELPEGMYLDSLASRVKIP